MSGAIVKLWPGFPFRDAPPEDTEAFHQRLREMGRRLRLQQELDAIDAIIGDDADQPAIVESH